MPDDHSELVPLLPIPNRTVKRLSADDSAGSRVKVGHRQATSSVQSPRHQVGALSSLDGSREGLQAGCGTHVPMRPGCFSCEVLAGKKFAPVLDKISKSG